MPTGLHHYGLHVWLWKNNPAGIFSATNPALKCPDRGYSLVERAPRLVQDQGHQACLREAQFSGATRFN